MLCATTRSLTCILSSLALRSLFYNLSQLDQAHQPFTFVSCDDDAGNASMWALLQAAGHEGGVGLPVVDAFGKMMIRPSAEEVIAARGGGGDGGGGGGGDPEHAGKVQTLVGMGFTASQAECALKRTSSVDGAAGWLLLNAGMCDEEPAGMWDEHYTHHTAHRTRHSHTHTT